MGAVHLPSHTISVITSKLHTVAEPKTIPNVAVIAPCWPSFSIPAAAPFPIVHLLKLECSAHDMIFLVFSFPIQ